MSPSQLLEYVAEQGRPAFIMMCGPPCSGKTTYVNSLKQISKLDLTIIHPDSALYDSSGRYVWTPEKASNALANCKIQLINAVKAQHPIIIYDATNTSASRRRGFLQLIDKNQKAFYQKILVLMPRLSKEDLDIRNQQRSKDRQIPSNIMTSMQSNFDNTQLNDNLWDQIIVASKDYL